METTTIRPRMLIEFPTAQAARDYRHEYGTGGWIFAPDGLDDEAERHRMPDRHKAILFPPEMSPADIFRHPITHGRSGDLIGNS